MKCGRFSGRRLGYLPVVVGVDSVRWLEFSSSNVLGERGECGDCLLLTLLRPLDTRDLTILTFESFLYVVRHRRTLFVDVSPEIIDVFLRLFGGRLLVVVQRRNKRLTVFGAAAPSLSSNLRWVACLVIWLAELLRSSRKLSQTCRRISSPVVETAVPVK